MCAMLAKTQQAEGKLYPAWTAVTLDEHGNILSDDLYPRIEANLRYNRTEPNIPTILLSDRVIGHFDQLTHLCNLQVTLH